MLSPGCLRKANKRRLIKSNKNTLGHWLSSKYFHLGLSLVISGLSLYLAARHVSWTEIWESLLQADWRWAGLAVLSVGVNNLTKIVRWQLLGTTANTQTSFTRLSLTFLVGQMLNAIYPGRVGDLSRIYLTGERAGERAFMLGTIVLEKALDVIAYTVLAAWMFLWMPMPTWIRGSVAGVVVVGLGVLVLLRIASRLRNSHISIPSKISGWLNNICERLSSSHQRQKLVYWLRMGSESLKVLDNPWLLGRVISLTVMVWVTALLNNYLVIKALNVDLGTLGNEARATLVILVGLMAGITIPTIPGRIGVFEYICVLSLQLFHVDQGIALTYGIVLHAVVFIPQIFFGLLALPVLGFGHHERQA